MPDNEPFSAMTSQQPPGRSSRGHSTSRQSISSLTSARPQHKPRDEERKEEEHDHIDDHDTFPHPSASAPSSSSYPALLSSLSATLRSRHSAVQSRLRSLSADHQQCKQQLLSALASYVSQAQRQLTAKQQQLIGHIHTLDTLDHTLSLPSLSPHQKQQAERDVHDLLTVVEQLSVDAQPPFDPFQVAAMQQLTEDNRRMAVELEEGKRLHEQDKAELQVELDRLIAQHEQMQLVIEHLTVAHQQPQQQPIAVAQQPHTTDEWKYEADTAALLTDKDRQLDTLTHDMNVLKRQKQQSDQTVRDTQTAWNKAKVAMEEERREWEQERERRREEEERREEVREVEEKRREKEREESESERRLLSEREQQRERLKREERQHEKQVEQQRQDERRQEERAARQREVEKERDALDKQRLQDELDHIQATLDTVERERREWMREKREWQDEKDREEAERDERESERDRDRQRLLEREAAALTELRREKQRMEEDVKGEAVRRQLSFVRAHKERVDSALQHITSLMQQQTGDDDLLPMMQSVDATDSDDSATMIAAFDASIDRLLSLVDRYTVWMTEQRENDKRRADGVLLTTQEKMGERLTQLIRTHAAEEQDRLKQQQQQQHHTERRAAEEQQLRQQQAAALLQQRQQEEEQWKRGREEESAEWEAERRRLEQDRREEVRAAILSCHREWRAKEDELRRQHQQRLDAILLQAKEETEQRITQQQAEVQRQMKQRQQQWEDERTELLTKQQQAMQHNNQQLAHLQHQLHTLTVHTEQADERQSLALAALQRTADDEVRRVRREAVEGHDRIAAALIESRAEVGRLLKGREKEKVEVELMRRQVSEWQADRRQWQEEKAAVLHEAARRQNEAERRWHEHIEEQRLEWEHSRRAERGTWKTEEQTKKRKEQQRWEQRLQQREAELSQQLTQQAEQRVREAQDDAARYKQQVDKEAQRYREQVEADARRRQQRLQEERQLIERDTQEAMQRLQREKREIEQLAQDQVRVAQPAASAAAAAVTNAVEGAVRKSSLQQRSGPSLSTTSAALISQQPLASFVLPIDTHLPTAHVDEVYDDNDSEDSKAEADGNEVTVQETSNDALALVPSSAHTSSISLSSSSRLSAARSASLSILASLPPSTFATGLLTRLASKSDPSPVPPTLMGPASAIAPLSSPRLSTAALYWRSRPSSISEQQPSSSAMGALDVSRIDEQPSGSEAAALDISSTTATRATTPSTSLLPSPESNRRSINNNKRYSMPPQLSTGTSRKGKQADSRERATSNTVSLR